MRSPGKSAKHTSPEIGNSSQAFYKLKFLALYSTFVSSFGKTTRLRAHPKSFLNAHHDRSQQQT